MRTTTATTVRVSRGSNNKGSLIFRLSHPLQLLLVLQSVIIPSRRHENRRRTGGFALVEAFATVRSTARRSPSTTGSVVVAPDPSASSTASKPWCTREPNRYGAEDRSSPSRSSEHDRTAGFARFHARVPEDTRRTFLSASLFSLLTTTTTTTTVTAPSPANAESVSYEDLTSRYYNEDGSPKGTADDNRAKFRTVSLSFPSSPTKNAVTSVDGAAPLLPPPTTDPSPDNAGPTTIEVSYREPDKWTPAPEYLDTSSELTLRRKACDRIVVYRLPDLYDDEKVLEKASAVGVTKALGLGTISDAETAFPLDLEGADVIGGRKVRKDDGSSDDDGGNGGGKRNYFEFDLAVAPKTCREGGEENLGLGFCPYDTIVLLGATIVERRMVVCGITCTRDEWKRSSADLKGVRDSFFVRRGREVKVEVAAPFAPSPLAG